MRKLRYCARFLRLSPQERVVILHPCATLDLRGKQELPMKTIWLPLMAVLTMSASAVAAPPSQRAVSLTQDPLVMRLNKDEFRIAFGINGERCGANGGSGMTRSRVDGRPGEATPR